MTGSAPGFDTDVAVVGGGPAGCATALWLVHQKPSLRGRVHVFEKHAHPREKHCGGAVSPWGMSILRSLALGDRVQGVPVTAVGLRMEDRVQRVARAGLGTVVRRAAFDAMLFHAAAERGVVTHARCAATGLARYRGGWKLETTQGVVTARVVVGADGASGGMRRLLGLSEPRRKAHLTIVETPGDEPRDGVSQGTLLFDLTPVTQGVHGYYWDFPSPLDGVAGTSRGIFHLNMDDRLDGAGLRGVFDSALGLRGVDTVGATRKPWAIRPYAPGAAASVAGALLTGEAVGVDPVTGEGIAHALAYGRLAADTVLGALATGDVGFQGWAATVAGSFVGRHLRQACALAPRVYGPRAVRWARAMADSPAMVTRGLDWYAGRPAGFTDALVYAAGLARATLREGRPW